MTARARTSPGRAPFVPADQAVRDEIRANLRANLCVEAGAGTGKTTVLVERIAEILRTGFATIDEIAVITFTEKAAAELAARVRDRLDAALAGPPEPAPDERERLRQAILGLHRARIETIHAFAANLLRERPIEARLDPNYEVLQGLAGGLAFDDAFDEWVHAMFAAGSPHRDLLRKLLNRGFDLKQMREAVDEVHRRRHAIPLKPNPAGTAPDLGAYVREVARIAAGLERVAPDCHDEGDPGLRQIALVAGYRDELRAVAGDPERLEAVVLDRAPWVALNAGSQASFGSPDSCKTMKDAFREFRPLTEEIQAAIRTEAITAFLPLAEDFVKGYTAKRRAAGEADFDDLLLWSRDLVRGDKEVRRYFQGRFRCLLVDEFQDTDPVQVELILAIASEPSDRPPGDWLDVRLRPGALFVVGDPKQSIYRFRRADISIYDRVKNGPLAAGVRELTQNFRSLSGIIDWVNGAFDDILVEEAGVQPRNIALQARPDELTLDRPPVVVVHGSEPVGKQTEVREVEAELLAALIARAVGTERWQVRDPAAPGGARDAGFGDVAVIVPTRTEIEIYEDTFERAGIPFRHEGSRSFFQRQEVRELAMCLRAVDDPGDKLAVVAALRSSAFACSDEDLFLHQAAKGRFGYLYGLEQGYPPVVEALGRLKELHDARRVTSLPELVHRLVSTTHLAEFALTNPHGEQTAGNLLKVVDQARAFAAAGGGGLRAFASWLMEGRDPDTDESEAAVMEETDPVVRLLTIHHAKGLEFPIVALGNASTRPPSQRQSFSDREPGRLHVKTGGKFATPGFDEAWTTEREYMEAERKRWLYVATTRARDHLIVPVVEKGNGRIEGLLGYLIGGGHVPECDPEQAGVEVDGCFVYDARLLEAGAAAWSNGRAARPSAAQVRAAIAARGEWEAERSAVLERASEGLETVTASSLHSWERPSSARPDEAEGAWILRGRAAAVGDALHRVMERVDLATGANLGPLAAALCAEAGVADRVDEVVEMARNCLASDAVRRAVARGEYWREVRFATEVDGKPVSGRVDLVFREGDGLVVVDYKTDRVGEGQIKQRVSGYAPQGATYKTGIELTVGESVSQVMFVFAHVGVEASSG